ncbi:hypothetical protein ACWWJF_00990 [Symbiopectobacterium sp. Eva_TO]
MGDINIYKRKTIIATDVLPLGLSSGDLLSTDKKSSKLSALMTVTLPFPRKIAEGRDVFNLGGKIIFFIQEEN